MKSDNALQQMVNLAGSLSREGHNISITAGGSSMFPAIKPGDIMIIEPISHSSTLKKGDIAVFTGSRGLVAHRIVRLYTLKGRPMVCTRGDSLPQADKSRPATEILGRVISLQTPGKKARSIVKHHPWGPLAVLWPVVFCCLKRFLRLLKIHWP